ncbi:MAG: hypothetical protein LQ348_001589 [Seirophora lacunosa]|nr:MAG: hypothetical protein LQ348_001589 [Seirophora lacunosa]
MTPNADFVRRTNLPHILEDSDGSLSWVLEPSPKPENGPNKSPARASRPEQLGLGTTGRNLEVNIQQHGGGPRSAPPQIHSFEQAEAYSSNRGPWNDSASDSRWLRNPEEMQRQGSSNVTSAYPSSTHLELLAAQFGIKEGTQTGPQGPAYVERRPSTHGPQTGISSFQAPQGHQVPPSIFPGRGFDNLRAYVEMAADGQSIQRLASMNLGGHSQPTNPRQVWDSPAVAGGSENLERHYTRQQNTGSVPAVGQGLPPTFGSMYGETAMQQQYLSWMQQQYGQSPGIFPPQLVAPQGIMQGPSYMAPQHQAPMAYYPGRQLNPQAGAFLPYGPPYFPNAGLGMHGVMGHPMQQQYLPNSAMAFNPMAQQMPPFMTAPVRPLHQSGAQWPQASTRAYAPSSRTASPMPPRTQSRGGRQVVSDVLYLPYRPGSDDMYPHANAEGTSVRLQELQRQGPIYAVAASPENLPFVETARLAKPAEWGVLRIGNIPYSLTKQEVLGFLGRNAKILTSDIGVPIHIIMDRTNGKTMDCYVEFFSHGDAQAAFNKCLLRGSQLRLGDRVVDVSMSTQDELLKEMFPKAKNVTWNHGRPIVRESNDPYNSGFKAFVTNEELLQLVGYAEKPHRCLQRPYESMISLLSKFPWFAVDRYTLRTRDEIYRQTLRLIALLVDQLRRGHEAYLPHLSESLLSELLYAGLNAPAFSEQQRWQLCQAGGPVGERIRMSPLAPYWPFDVLGRKAGVDEDVVREYAKYLQSHPRNTSIDGAFGTWTAQSNEALGLTTIGQVGAHEMQMVLSMLQDVLPPRTS